MNQESTRISELWKKEYSQQISTYSRYGATKQFEKIAALFTPGKSYFYILNLHNLELDFVSPEVEKFIDISHKEVCMQDLLRQALPEEIHPLEQKEILIKDFYGRFLATEEITSYKLMYTYRMQDHTGKICTILHQATPLSVAENGTPEHILSIHSDISHLRAGSSTDVSFINLSGGTSYFNINPEKGFFDPAFEDRHLAGLRDSFTKREKEILCLLAKGLNAENIAESLNVSVHTVKTHRKNILKKSRCNNTTQLVAKCLTGGIVSHYDL